MYRILHIRLVLLRPNVLSAARQVLLDQTPTHTPSRSEARLRAEVSTICVHAAVSAIDMLHANLRSATRIISSNATFVTLSAATVLVAASLLPELEVNVDDGNGPYAKAISNAFEVLDEHRWQIQGAPKAMEQLEKFIETVDKGKKRIHDGMCFSL